VNYVEEWDSLAVVECPAVRHLGSVYFELQDVKTKWAIVICYVNLRYGSRTHLWEQKYRAACVFRPVKTETVQKRSRVICFSFLFVTFDRKFNTTKQRLKV